MGIKDYLYRSTIANYGRAIRATPREVICNRHLIFTAMMFAMVGVPQTWDQGSSATVPSLEGFQSHFGLSSGSDAEQISNFVSIIYIGYTIGAAASFLLNNRLGRLWIIAEIGIGSSTVVGPMALVEISPAEIRGLLTSWYVVAVSLALIVSNFCVYGIFKHVPAGRLQYQIAWFAPCIYMALCILSSFFLCESPRWLLLVGRRSEAIQTLVRIRGVLADHPRVETEIREIEEDIAKSRAENPSSFMTMAKELLTIPSNLRRLQQVLVPYALAQLSGANSITSYFIPIMKIVGQASEDTSESIFLSGMYCLAKRFFTLIASFLFIDALGRRKSLLVGVAIQMLSHIYIGVYIKKTQEGPVSTAASQGAIAALFIHAYGYAVGLLILPYVFGSELWPNRIRSLGTAAGSTFHWLFIYALKYSIPSLLDATNDWGAFIFFAAWCFLAWVYVFFMVPEVAGMVVEEIEDLFKGPWFKAYRQRPRLLEGRGEDDEEGGVVKTQS